LSACQSHTPLCWPRAQDIVTSASDASHGVLHPQQAIQAALLRAAATPLADRAAVATGGDTASEHPGIAPLVAAFDGLEQLHAAAVLPEARRAARRFAAHLSLALVALGALPGNPGAPLAATRGFRDMSITFMTYMTYRDAPKA
jgi:hypothetical protein